MRRGQRARGKLAGALGSCSDHSPSPLARPTGPALGPRVHSTANWQQAQRAQHSQPDLSHGPPAPSYLPHQPVGTCEGGVHSRAHANQPARHRVLQRREVGISGRRATRRSYQPSFEGARAGPNRC